MFQRASSQARAQLFVVKVMNVSWRHHVDDLHYRTSILLMSIAEFEFCLLLCVFAANPTTDVFVVNSRQVVVRDASLAGQAIKNQQTISQIASSYGIHPNQVTSWKKQLLSSAADIFTDPRKKAETDEPSSDELFRQIGQLKVELEWLKKNLNSCVSDKRGLICPDFSSIPLARQDPFGALSPGWIGQKITFKRDIFPIGLFFELFQIYNNIGPTPINRKEGFYVDESRFATL